MPKTSCFPRPHVAVVFAALLLSSCEPPPGSDVPKAYRYDLQTLRDASAASSPDWSQPPQIPLPLRDPRAIALAHDTTLLAAGDRAIVALDPSGAERWRARLPSEPRCIACSPDGTIFVGYLHHVATLDPAGKLLADWPSLGEGAVITSIAATTNRVWIADAGARKVATFDFDGTLTSFLSGPDEFVVPSPFFDVAADPRGGVWVVNPGWLRVEHYGPDGRQTKRWGAASMDPGGFAGCCNPVHIALLPDGGFATAEKGIPRVKTYGPDGVFRAIVAGAGEFPEDAEDLDLAADAAGRILVLDRARRAVRVFEPKTRKQP